MSIFANVNKEFAKYQPSDESHEIFGKILDALSDKEIKLWHKEVELWRELTPEYGTRPDFDEILEREIYARGLEAK